MASSSSGGYVSRYDVFLSFRGEDTRDSFTDHLYQALRRAGIYIFRDDDAIPRGEDLKPEIKRGIRESRASIIVLSEFYATSRWCLDELYLIHKQRKTCSHFVLPIFYHVDPSLVRKREGTFKIEAKAGTKWTEDKVKEWNKALRKVGNMTGEVVSGECQVLKRIRHRNLIRIITACSLPDFKALVLPFMANGSLDNRLYPDSPLGSGSSDLNLIQRVMICSDIAEGMAYLHHHSPIKVIHCDLKPSNILLNDDFTALVSDFGIAKLVMTIGGGNEKMGNSTADMLCGSIGYIAPEYAYGSITSTKGDVYSFGILVLEMVTRKRPTDDMFSEGLSIHKWVKTNYHRHMEHVVDSTLVQTTRDQLLDVKKMWEVAIGELLEMGILCTQELPSSRPTMLDVAGDLDRLQRYLTGDTTATFASSLGILNISLRNLTL